MLQPDANMGLHKFFSHIAVIGIITNFLTIISLIEQYEMYNPYGYGFLSVIDILFCIAIIVSCGIYFSHRHEYSMTEYKAALVRFIIPIVYNIYLIIIANSYGLDKNEFFARFLGTFIVSSIVLIYYKKRKYIFEGNYSYYSEINTEIVENDSKETIYAFACTACGKESTGWYQTCPNCGAIGKMQRLNEPIVISNDVERSLLPDIDADCSLLSDADAFETIAYCKECGAKLNLDSLFCPNCGTAVNEDIEIQENADMLDSDESSAVQVQPVLLDISKADISPKLRRAFIFLEDGLWEKADKYIDEILDAEPENAYAYLGELMFDVKASTFEELSSHKNELLDNINYKRAMKYGDEELASFLKSIIE